ncbi:MAG: universal stress protein [Pseudomonadota bacterium]
MYKDILLSIDVATESTWKKPLPTSVEYARAFDATLHMMTVVPDFGMSIVGQYFPKGYEKQALKHAQDALHAFTESHVPDGVRIQHIIAHGRIYREVLRVADEINADLIVMAAHRPETGSALLGSNAEQVVRHAKQSVLVVRD